jgi:uncharacterized membrane protein YgcG
MIAYNAQWMSNLAVVNVSREAFDAGLLGKEEMSAVETHYSIGFYTPHFVIRIGLFLLCLVILLFSFGLFALLFMSNIEHAYTGLLLAFSILCFIALEIMINRKKHFCSGVDDALLYVGYILFLVSIFLLIQPSEMVLSGLAFMISLAAVIRYADRLMVLLAFLSLGGFLFYGAIEFGSLMKFIIPFLLMVYSALCYFFSQRFKSPDHNNTLNIYTNCLQFLKIVSLLGIYISVNYWVVRELSNIMFNLQLQTGQSIPFGWFFWITTLLIPTWYILYGIKKKDRIFLRIGMCLVAAMIITIRYYYPLFGIEWWMSAAGLGMISASWLLIRYLQIPRNGFTDRQEPGKYQADASQSESLVQAETFSSTNNPVDGTSFGGGSFGGGGSTGTF